MLLRAAVAVICFAAAAAEACPTCSCANPALTSLGADQPFAGRLRLASTLRAWAQVEGAARVDQTVLRELRLDLTASWAPVQRLTLQLTVPLQARERREVSFAAERGLGPGEVDLSARVLLVGADRFRPRHLLSVVATARLPTAPTLRDGAGVPLDADAQLGPGAFVPGLGLFWSAFIGDRWSTFVSVLGDLPLEGRFGLRVGPGLQAVGLAQFQPLTVLALRAGLDARYEALSFQRGVPTARLQGLLVQAAADLVVSPTSRWLLTVGARVPFADTRPRGVSTSPILLVSAVVDL